MVHTELAGLAINEDYKQAIVTIVSGCQEILRRSPNECSFVSLRDVARFIEVSAAWGLGDGKLVDDATTRMSDI